MYHRIIITGGISLLTNAKQLIDKAFPDFFTTDETLTDEKVAYSEKVLEFLIEHFKKLDNPKDLSAEFSMANVLRKTGRLVDAPAITLLYTDTLKGKTAADANKWLLEEHFNASVKLVKIYINVNNRYELNRSLGNYLSEVSDALQEGEPKSTCFAPIGGYKVMTSLGYLVGSLHHYPTAYLHERTDILHEIPPVQLKVDEDFIIENNQFLKKLLKEDFIEIKNLTENERKIVEKQTIFINEEEEHVYLNPFGRFLCDQPKYYRYFKPNVYIASTVKDFIDKRFKHHWNMVYKEILQLIDQHNYRRVENLGTLYHESSFEKLKKQSFTYHLFKGGNNPVFRATWKYDESEDAYYIAKVWLNHNSYEREVNDFIGLLDQNDKWVNITEKIYKF